MRTPRAWSSSRHAQRPAARRRRTRAATPRAGHPTTRPARTSIVSQRNPMPSAPSTTSASDASSTPPPTIATWPGTWCRSTSSRGHSRNLPNRTTPPPPLDATLPPDAPGPRALDRDREPGRRARSGPGPPPPRARRARRRRPRRRDRAVGRRRRPRRPGPRRVRARAAPSSRAGATAPSACSRASPPTRAACSASCPLGSGNDFARQLDLPRGDLAAAIDVLRTGQVLPTDLGRAHTADGATHLVHDRRQHRLRRGRERVGQRRHLDERHPALRARDAAHARRVLAHARARHRRRHRHRDRRVAGRGGQHAHLRERDDDHARGRACTTACSTCASSARCRAPSSSARSRRCSRAPTSSTRRCAPRAGRTSIVEALDPTPAVDLWASGEHAGPLPARLEPVAGALGGRGAAPTADYLTVSVPSMPWRAVAGDAAVEGVLPGLQIDLLRLRPAATVGLELEARVGAVEHEVVDAVLGGELDRRDPRVGGDRSSGLK